MLSLYIIAFTLFFLFLFMNTCEFIKQANIIHNGKYDYSKVNYINPKIKVCIICPAHGEFWQLPYKHLSGQGCKLCNKYANKWTTSAWIEMVNKIHNNKYDYSKANYINAKTPICIICPVHGEFWQLPENHSSGKGCNLCKNELIGKINSSNIDNFVKRSNIIHNGKYDYSKSNYINNITPLTIICPIHGEFEQTPKSHLQGSGCYICNFSKLENEIKKMLDDNNIKYISQQKFSWLLSDKKNNNQLKLDFYLPEYNIAIECQGIQHFKPTKFKNISDEKAISDFNKSKKYDEIKQLLCEEHGIKLLYYSNLHIEYPYEVFENKEELLNKILKKE